MAKIRNKRIYSKDQAWLVYLREEYTLYGDFYTTLEPGCLTIYARKPQRPKKKKKHEKSERNKRAESAARNSRS